MMNSERPDVHRLNARLDAILDRLQNLEVQVRGLVISQAVEARKFVVKDDRGKIRARLEMREYSPLLTFFDRLGTERLGAKPGEQHPGSPYPPTGLAGGSSSANPTLTPGWAAGATASPSRPPNWPQPMPKPS